MAYACVVYMLAMAGAAAGEVAAPTSSTAGQKAIAQHSLNGTVVDKLAPMAQNATNIERLGKVVVDTVHHIGSDRIMEQTFPDSNFGQHSSVQARSLMTSPSRWRGLAKDEAHSGGEGGDGTTSVSQEEVQGEGGMAIASQMAARETIVSGQTSSESRWVAEQAKDPLHGDWAGSSPPLGALVAVQDQGFVQLAADTRALDLGGRNSSGGGGSVGVDWIPCAQYLKDTKTSSMCWDICIKGRKVVGYATLGSRIADGKGHCFVDEYRAFRTLSDYRSTTYYEKEITIDRLLTDILKDLLDDANKTITWGGCKAAYMSTQLACEKE